MTGYQQWNVLDQTQDIRLVFSSLKWPNDRDDGIRNSNRLYKPTFRNTSISSSIIVTEFEKFEAEITVLSFSRKIT